MRVLSRSCAVSVLLCAIASPAAAQEPTAGAQPATATAPAVFEVSGTVHSGKTPLPAATITAANTLTGKKTSILTALDGSFTLKLTARGRYVIRAEFPGFAAVTQEVVLNPQTPSAKLDLELMLASRAQQQEQANSAALQQTGLPAQAGRGFQNLAAAGMLSELANWGNAPESGAPSGAGAQTGDLSALPFGGANSSAESVSFSGAMGRSEDFGSGSEEEIQERIREFRERVQREGGGFGPGGGPGGAVFGGPPGGGPGPGGPFIILGGRGGRGFNLNQPHGVLYYSDGNSIFDARPYSLSGQPTAKAGYNQARFGAFIGGPLNIPKVFHGGRNTFFFLGYNGGRFGTPYDAFSTVPTQAERSGDFSASRLNNAAPVQIFDPTTGQPFANNTVPQINPAAQTLLAFIPLPNLAGTVKNFHYVTSADTASDSVNFRLVHNFNSAGSASQSGGATGGRGGPAGPGGRGGFARRFGNNLNFGVNFTRNDSDIVNPFPSLAGNNSMRSWNTNAGYVLSRGRWTNNLRFNYNRNRVSLANLYTFLKNIIGEAGIGGVSQDPFDYGLPTLSLTNFAGLNDPAARRTLNQAFTFSEFASWTRGRHTLRFGGDYRRILQDLRADRNARGSFTFTGFATAEYDANGQPVPGTGYDFADFLLGLPQLTSVQSGASSYSFRANAFDLFVQDDWRVLPKLTLNLGLRYEYNGPYTEAHNRMVNLDVAPGFTAVAPVEPGQTGAFTGAFPPSLVEPDRNNWAPRIGIAWRPFRGGVFRAGYGINYNLVQYGSIIQSLAFQPPFAITSTNISSLASPLTFQDGFPSTSGTVTNNFAVARDYRLGYVQIWNLDLQFTLPGNVVVNAGYNGAKGTHLDMQRAPNRGPSGLLIPGVQAFLFESSEANSILHVVTLRARKRLSHGLSLAGSYTFSKSIDNASSIGGGAVVVAQNDLDLAAERGLSSFDQRHRFTGNWIYELPFGPMRRFVRGGTIAHVLDNWQWSGDFTIASGLPFTARILGNFADVARGTNGTLRADYTGAPISIGNPTVQTWFNTAAFVLPAEGSFGNAGRNTIEGPGQTTFNMALSKTIQFKEPRSLELRAQASNVFNKVQFVSIDTVVNSPTYGQVISAGAMRRMQLSARYRF